MIRLRRRRYLISKLQVRLLLTIAAYALVTVLAFGGLVFLPLALDMSDPDLTEAQRAEAGTVFLALDLRLWPAIAAILLAIGGHAILVTHRVVGPLYRMCQVMKAAACGDDTTLARIRKRDLLHAEADVLNELLLSVRRRKDTILKDTDQLREVLSRPLDDPEAVLRELTEWVEKLEEHLDGHAAKSPGPVGRESHSEHDAALPTAQSRSAAIDPGGGT